MKGRLLNAEIQNFSSTMLNLLDEAIERMLRIKQTALDAEDEYKHTYGKDLFQKFSEARTVSLDLLALLKEIEEM